MGYLHIFDHISGQCPQTQCMLPFASANDTWLVQSHMVPSLPQQPPFGVQVLSTSSESSKRMNHMYSPVYKCINGDLLFSYDADYEASHGASEEMAQLRPPAYPDALCACPRRHSSVFPSHQEHLNRSGSPGQSPIVMRNMVNYLPPRMYPCSCCLDHRQFQWTNHTGHKNVKSPIF